MTKITVINLVVLLTVLLYCTIRVAESFESDHGHKEALPMWFGPRIGRKKRNPGDNKGYRNDKDQSTLGLLDVLRDSPLVVVAVNEANKQHDFTPRLGRESGETPSSWLDDVENADATDSLSSRINNPFSPRLGRNNYNPFSPRLGRESDVPPSVPLI